MLCFGDVLIFAVFSRFLRILDILNNSKSTLEVLKQSNNVQSNNFTIRTIFTIILSSQSNRMNLSIVYNNITNIFTLFTFTLYTRNWHVGLVSLFPVQFILYHLILTLTNCKITFTTCGHSDWSFISFSCKLSGLDML